MRLSDRVSRAAVLAIGIGVLGSTNAAGQNVPASALVRLDDLLLVPAGEVAGDDDGVAYRYLPSRLRIATGSHGTPQLIFFRHTREDTTTHDGSTRRVSRGLLHALVEWGFDEPELRQAQIRLDRQCGESGDESRNATNRALQRFEGVLSEDAADSESPEPGRFRLYAGRVASVKGPSIVTGELPCGTIIGPAPLSGGQLADDIRIHVGAADEPLGVSPGSVKVLPAQRMLLTFELVPGAARLLGSYEGAATSSLDAEGSWWLGLDFGLPEALEGDDRISTVYTIDPWFEMFERREIHFSIADAVKDLGDPIAHIGIQLVKPHGDGSISRESFIVDEDWSGNSVVRLSHGFKNDRSRDRRYYYRYRTFWTFTNGATHDSGWRESESASVWLQPPYVKHDVEIEINPDLDRRELANSDSVAVEVSHPFFEQPRVQRRVLKHHEIRSEWFDFAIRPPRSVARDSMAFDYKVTWYLRDGSTRSTKGSSSERYVHIDEETVEVVE